MKKPGKKKTGKKTGKKDLSMQRIRAPSQWRKGPLCGAGLSLKICAAPAGC